MVLFHIVFFTFEKLINYVVLEGLTLCNDLNLKNHLKKQKLTWKKELGQFCNQFGTYAFLVPSPSTNSKTLSKKSFGLVKDLRLQVKKIKRRREKLFKKNLSPFKVKLVLNL